MTDPAAKNFPALYATVVAARAEAERLACSYSGVCQVKGEPDDAYLARLAIINARQKASREADRALFAALIALAAAEDAAAAAARAAA